MRMLNRSRTGQLLNTLQRISIVASEKPGSVFGAEQRKPLLPLPVSLHDGDGKAKAPTTANIDAFCSGDVLDVAGQEYQVAVNPPSVHGVVLPSYIVINNCVIPLIHSEFTENVKFKYEWRRLVPVGRNACEEIVVSTESRYTPTEEDEGYRLSLSVSPVMPKEIPDQRPIVGTSQACVQGVGKLGHRQRSEETVERYDPGSNKLRVCTYNILADCYAMKGFPTAPPFPYCPTNALNITYRDALLLNELPAYNADILCMQEVETRRFESTIKPRMDKEGYVGELSLKKGVTEGIATMWRTDRFELLDVRSHVLGDSLLKNKNLNELRRALGLSMCADVGSRNSVLQLVHLVSKSNGNSIIVGNTHLFYRATARAQRLAMAVTIMTLMASYKEEMSPWSISKLPPALLLCGDFNSTPEKAVHEIITTGKLASDHECRTYREMSGCVNHSCSHPLKFSSAVPHKTVQWSNYTADFVGLLDYIYFDDSAFTVHKVVPMPSKEQVEEFTALPSERYCSDHLPVIADLELKS